MRRREGLVGVSEGRDALGTRVRSEERCTEERVRSRGETQVSVSFIQMGESGGQGDPWYPLSTFC